MPSLLTYVKSFRINRRKEVNTDNSVVFNNLKKAIRTGQTKNAILIALTLIGTETKAGMALWSALRASASEDVSYTQYHLVTLVKDLFNNWMHNENPAYISHAIAALCEAPKGTSAADLLK
jgi:hypothetical protein